MGANDSRNSTPETPPLLSSLGFSIALAVVALLCFALLAHQIDDGATRHFDSGVDGYFHVHQSPPLHLFMTGVSFFASPPWLTLLVCSIAIGYWRRHAFWPDGFTILLAAGGGELLVMALKLLFHRPRPYEVFSNLGYSFPSGHSFFSLTIYGFIAYLLARDAPPARRDLIYLAAAAIALLVGFSRVVLTVHYPSDVIGGYTVAIPWLWGCIQLPRTMRRKERARLAS